jgi:hypothetical protein
MLRLQVRVRERVQERSCQHHTESAEEYEYYESVSVPAQEREQ